MNLHVEAVILLLGEVLAAHGAGAALVLAVRAPHVAVVGGVRSEGFAAVLALEGLLPRVLADVSAQDAGRCERLEGQGSSRQGRKRNGVASNLLSHVQSPPSANPDPIRSTLA